MEKALESPVFLDFWYWISYNKDCYKKKDLDGDSKADQTLQRAGDGERPVLVGQFQRSLRSRWLKESYL